MSEELKKQSERISLPFSSNALTSSSPGTTLSRHFATSPQVSFRTRALLFELSPSVKPNSLEVVEKNQEASLSPPYAMIVWRVTLPSVK